MKDKIRAIVVLLALGSLLVSCAPPTELPSTPTAEPPPPTSAPEPTDTPEPRDTPEPTNTPEPTDTLEPTNTPEATDTPKPTDTPEPTNTPEATEAPPPAPADTPAPTPEPQPAALEGLMIFPVFDAEAETYHIYSAKPDGSERKLLVEEASQPAFNSDGQRIVYRSWKADNRGLFERGREADDARLINIHFEAARPSFSPDDLFFVFQSREGGEHFAIYRTVDQEHEVLRRETFPIQGEAPALAPDGQSFVYKGWLGNDNGLIWSQLDGSFPQQLTQELSDTNPAISPDGQTIAFMSWMTENWDIFTMGIDGSERKQLTTELASDGLPTWSPDGKTIAFVSDRSGEWAIWAMSADGSDQRLLFELGGSIDGLVKVDVQNSRGWIEETIDWAP